MGYKKTVKNTSELEDALTKIILDSMKVIAKDAVKEVKEHVQSDVYDSMTPKSYKRTRELKKSVKSDTYRVGSFVSSVIYHDPSVMKPVAPYAGNNRMGQHHSTVRSYFPQEYSFFLPRTINDGTSGKIFGSGIWTQPRPYFTNAEKKIMGSFKKDLKEQLIKRGLTVK